MSIAHVTMPYYLRLTVKYSPKVVENLRALLVRLHVGIDKLVEEPAASSSMRVIYLTTAMMSELELKRLIEHLMAQPEIMQPIKTLMILTR